MEMQILPPLPFFIRLRLPENNGAFILKCTLKGIKIYPKKPDAATRSKK